MKHYAAVSHIPGSPAGHLIAGKAILEPDFIMRKGLVVIHMPVFGRKLIVFLIVHPDHVVLNNEGVFVIIIHLMPRNLNVPARQVFAIEQ